MGKSKKEKNYADSPLLNLRKIAIANEVIFDS